MSFTIHHRSHPATVEKQQSEADDPTCEMSLSTMESDPAELVQTSFSELAFASMDMDRHQRSTSTPVRHDDSYCDGLGESMFGESFAIDDCGVHMVEAQQQRRQQQQQQTVPQLSPVADDEGEECYDQQSINVQSKEQ